MTPKIEAKKSIIKQSGFILRVVKSPEEYPIVTISPVKFTILKLSISQNCHKTLAHYFELEKGSGREM